jgi:recombination protein RecR
MAYHLLERNREGGLKLSQALAEAMDKVGHCKQCRDFSETELCATCASGARERSLLCAVENPADRLAIEQATGYRGLYFVLQGRLSPLDGIGPKDIHLDRLIKRADDGVVRELIVATNFTMEGEATAHYIAELLLARGLKVSRIARGLPVGGELEHVDSGTLAQAVIERRSIEAAP